MAKEKESGREPIGQAAAAPSGGFLVTVAFALAPAEKAYIQRVIDNQFPGAPVIVIDQRANDGKPAPVQDKRRRGWK